MDAGGVAKLLEDKGLRVSRIEEKLKALDGAWVSRFKVVGFDEAGSLRVSVVFGSYVFVQLIARLDRYQHVAERAEELNLDLDVDREAGMLHVAFKARSAGEVASILDSLL